MSDINSEDERSSGVNCANSLIRQSIDTRCSLIEDLYGDSEAGDEIHTNADYALFCLEFTDSLYDIFKDHLNGAGDSMYDRGFKSQIRHFFELFKPLQSWLQKTSIENIYNN